MAQICSLRLESNNRPLRVQIEQELNKPFDAADYLSHLGIALDDDDWNTLVEQMLLPMRDTRLKQTQNHKIYLLSFYFLIYLISIYTYKHV